MSKKSQYIGFECEPDLKKQVRKAAKREERSLSSWLRRVVRLHLEAGRRLREDEDELQTA